MLTGASLVTRNQGFQELQELSVELVEREDAGRE